MSTKLFKTIIIATFGCLQLAAQPSSTQIEKMERFINALLAEVEIVPGLSVSVAKQEGVHYANGFGYLDLNQQITADQHSNFYIASCTKSYNSLLAIILAEEGQLELEKPILHYKPFKDFDNKATFEGVTIMDLLSHQSGIENPYLSLKLAYSGLHNHEELLQLIDHKTQFSADGRRFNYSNFGYYLLDVLLKEELDKSWKDLLEEKIFQPLGLEHTTAYISKADPNNLAYPYATVFPDQPKEIYLHKTDKTMHAAGGLVTNAEDAAKYIAFFLSKGKIKGQQIYPAPYLQTCYERQVDATHTYSETFPGNGYALGWRLGEYQGQEMVYHFGGYPGFFSHISFLPEADLGISIFVNHANGAVIADHIATYLYDLYLNDGQLSDKIEKNALAESKKAVKRMQKRKSKQNKEFAERTWNLSLPNTAYVGKYNSDIYGPLAINLVDHQLQVKHGQLHAVGTPYPCKDCMRAALIPRSGSVIAFQVENQKVEGLKVFGATFSKIE